MGEAGGIIPGWAGLSKEWGKVTDPLQPPEIPEAEEYKPPPINKAAQKVKRKKRAKRGADPLAALGTIFTDPQGVLVSNDQYGSTTLGS